MNRRSWALRYGLQSDCFGLSVCVIENTCRDSGVSTNCSCLFLLAVQFIFIKLRKGMFKCLYHNLC